MRNEWPLIVVLLAAGCERQPVGPRPVVNNTVQGTDTRQIVYDGKTWVELTITQQVNPKCPAYVVGLRESTNFAGVLFRQTIAKERVVSQFRIQPVSRQIVLHREDFEWYPPMAGFPSVEIGLMPESWGSVDR